MLIAKPKNEALVRQWCSYFLRFVRQEIKKGYSSKSKNKQKEIINQRITELAEILGLKDFYYSKKIISERYKRKLSLRKIYYRFCL